MHALRDGYDGLSLMMVLNWDRLLFLATIGIALRLGAWLVGL